MLFKQSFQSIVMKIDAYLVSGIAGALRLNKGDKSDKCKKEIRRLINQGLGERFLTFIIYLLTRKYALRRDTHSETRL